MSALDLTPAPGAAPWTRMLLAQTATELRLTLRRGESLLLTVVIPVLLLALFAEVPLIALPSPRVAFLVPGVLALAVMSTAFTGQAIATGFERQYGVLKRLGATALSRPLLLAAKTLGVLAVEALQAVLVVGVGLALGWSPGTGPPGAAAAAGLLVLGTAAFSGLGLLLAGTLRAEATLALANLVYLLLLAIGGVVFPLDRFPGPLRALAGALPTGALAEGLRGALAGAGAGAVPGHTWAVLAAWALAGLAAAAATFRWE